MKFILFSLTMLVTQISFAFDPYEFTCDMNGSVVQSLPGIKKAPENPVVGLNIKVIKNQVPLFLIQANTPTGTKNLFATDWVAKDQVSQEGLDLLDLLELFFNVKVANLKSLRAALPTDLLDGFAYVELLEDSGTVTKLGFEGTNPTVCK